MAVLTTTGVQSEGICRSPGCINCSARPRACDRPPGASARGARCCVRPDAGGHARALPNCDGRPRSRLGGGDRCSAAAGGDAHWLDRPSSDACIPGRRIESDLIVLLAATREGYPSVLLDAGLPERTLAGLDEATAAALLDAAALTFRCAHSRSSARRQGTRWRCSSCRRWPADTRTTNLQRVDCR